MSEIYKIKQITKTCLKHGQLMCETWPDHVWNMTHALIVSETWTNHGWGGASWLQCEACMDAWMNVWLDVLYGCMHVFMGGCRMHPCICACMDACMNARMHGCIVHRCMHGYIMYKLFFILMIELKIKKMHQHTQRHAPHALGGRGGQPSGAGLRILSFFVTSLRNYQFKDGCAD